MNGHEIAQCAGGSYEITQRITKARVQQMFNCHLLFGIKLGVVANGRF